MMRILSSTSKPMSSPGRTEKFPPPLMRFLRTKSRGKNTRPKYPLFLRRKKAITSSSTAIEATQEPSSPKVTCIGQVRVTRSKSKSKSKPKTSNKKPTKKSCYCCCFEKANVKLWKPPKVKNWVWFFNCRSVKVRTDSSKFGSNRFEEKEENKTEVEVRGINNWSCMQEEEVTATSITTPPKNALLLTRCRSAPYRSSSLACQFWGSPLRKTGSDEERESDERNIALGIEDSRDSTSSNSRGDQDSSLLSNGIKKDAGEDLGICVQNNVHVKDKVVLTCSSSPTSANKVDIIEDVVGIQRSIVLKRCKSEPRASNLCKFDPDTCDIWRHTRLSDSNNRNCNVQCTSLSPSA